MKTYTASSRRNLLGSIPGNLPGKLLGLFLVTVLTSSSAQLGSQIPVPAKTPDSPLLLIGARIHPVVGKVLEKGELLIVDGKIAAIGQSVKRPDKVQTVDLTGLDLYPGLIDAHTCLGLVEVNAVRSTRDLDETGDLTPEVRALISINPESMHIPVTRSNGVLTVLTIPQGGLVSGRSGLMSLEGWTWEHMSVRTTVGIHVRWPRMSLPEKEEERKKARKARDAKLDKIRELFSQARAYGAARKSRPDTQQRDLALEALQAAIRRQEPVFLHANGFREIRAALLWAQEARLRPILVGGLDAARLTDLLQRMEVPVILTGINRIPLRRDDAYDTAFSLPRRLQKAGIPYCIAGKDTPFEVANIRNLPYEAGRAVAYGLSPEEALRAITILPARILGIDDRQGSLEVGKEATLFAARGNILEVTTPVLAAWIPGRPLDLSDRHKRLYRKYRKRVEGKAVEGKRKD